MISRAPLALCVLGCFVLSSCGPSVSAPHRRLFDSHNLLRHAGYAGLGHVSSGEVGPDQSRGLRARFSRDACYVLAAFGSDGLDDLGLTILGPDESPVAEERGTGRNAIVSFCAERSGVHQVTVTAEQGAGDFQLAYWSGSSDEEVGPGDGNRLTLGRTVTGVLPPGQRFVDYTLTIERRRPVTINLESRDFDTYLYLLRQGIQLTRNDDGGAGLNSRIAISLEPGTYTVRVGSFGDRGSGQFTLVAR